jgi:molecular chaperone GrpE
MSENEKDENSLTESQENVEQNDESLDDVKEISEEFKGEISQANEEVIQAETSDLNLLLEKEKKKSLRLLADYQNLEKQIIDRINARGDKIILDFLTVYEDFVRAKNVYEKEGGNVDSLNSIIKNMESILDHYEVKPIETEGKKLDPKLHEVVQEIEDNSNEEGTIVKEIAKGYIIRGKIFKYSKVCVSKKLIKK